MIGGDGRAGAGRAFDAVRVRRSLPLVLGPKHPLLEAAFAAVDDGVLAAPLIRVLHQFATALDRAGCSPLDVDPAWIEAWLATSTSDFVRGTRLAVLRSVYRHAAARQLIATPPTRGLHRAGATTPPAARILSADEVRRVVVLLRRPADRPLSGVVMRRDLLVVGLGMWLGCGPEQIRQLYWRDVRLGERSTLRLPGTDRDLEVPASVERLFRGYRDELARAGVMVVDADAVLAAYHPSLQFAWLRPDRELLHPLEKSALTTMIHDHLVQAGLLLRGVRSLYRLDRGLVVARLQWFERPDIAAVDAALADEASTRVPMSRPRAAGS